MANNRSAGETQTNKNINRRENMQDQRFSWIFNLCFNRWLSVRHIAKLSPNSSYNWAQLALFSLDPNKPRKPRDTPLKPPDKPRKPSDMPRKLPEKPRKPSESLF